MGLTVTCTMTATARTRLARLETLLLVAGSVTRLRAGRLGIASCAGIGARLLIAVRSNWDRARMMASAN
ncbi:hypothetical protein CCUS01_06368 [Colletotrichum cuscutae]|uniref:Uncharacterized protein n=1 Tax=Colletotrichum cuscutae TaxID=1209917 RepID=A0AAI9Y2X7_9PEZI|nr:hypothetical protein CCUS01_06368 [Colletotrichum cuscutae]